MKDPVKIPRSTSAGVEHGQRPVWYVWRHFIMLICPNGHGGPLRTRTGDGHEIDAHGNVTPSVVCPDCDFHETITLEDWIDPWTALGNCD